MEQIDKALLVYLTVEKRCPATLDELVDNGSVSRHSLQDQWGTRIEHQCSDRGTRVRSAGRDKTFDTADDIQSQTVLQQDAPR